MLRDSREDSLMDTYKATPPMSHTDSPRGKIIFLFFFFYPICMDTLHLLREINVVHVNIF